MNIGFIFYQKWLEGLEEDKLRKKLHERREIQDRMKKILGR